MRWNRNLAASLVIAAAAMGLTSAAVAKTCSDTTILAKGEASRYLWLAKTKARANWRSKVRRTPGLGSKFARWGLAEDADERCASGPSGTLCTFSGTPCAP